jgi:hypothetical protein
MSKNPRRQIRESAERDYRDALVDRAYWQGKWETVTHPVAKRTYQRGIDDAEARITEARNRLDR